MSGNLSHRDPGNMEAWCIILHCIWSQKLFEMWSTYCFICNWLQIFFSFKELFTHSFSLSFTHSYWFIYPFKSLGHYTQASIKTMHIPAIPLYRSPTLSRHHSWLIQDKHTEDTSDLFLSTEKGYTRRPISQYGLKPLFPHDISIN